MGEENLIVSLFGEESEDEGEAARSAASYSEEEGEGEAESGGEREESEGEREGSEVEKEESEADQERISRRSSDDGGAEEVSAASGSDHDGRAQEAEEPRSEEIEEPAGADKIRQALGDSDEDEQEEVDGPRHRKSATPEYDSDEERVEGKKAKGPPLTIDMPLRPPPSQSHNMNLVRVSNIMDIESKPFDPKTYVEDDTFVTDEAGRKQRLRLEENVVRWRCVRDRDGTPQYESNARFVKWSDGTMQLLIGNEVLDLSVQDGQQDESHLFLRHSKLLLQAQGKLARKMRFMPSSLTSKSHRLLTALVDSRHKKMYKVKKVVTDVDPEKEKEQKEKAAEQRIKSKEELQKKQEKTMRKFAPQREREPQLSPGYLEGALEEEEEDEDYDPRRYQEQLEAESRAERRINQAKRPPAKSKEKRAHRNKREMLEDDSSEESDHRGRGGGRAAVSDDENEEEDGGDDEEIEREQERPGRKRRERHEEQQHQQQQHSPPRKQRRRAVVSDSDEE